MGGLFSGLFGRGRDRGGGSAAKEGDLVSLRAEAPKSAGAPPPAPAETPRGEREGIRDYWEARITIFGLATGALHLVGKLPGINNLEAGKWLVRMDDKYMTFSKQFIAEGRGGQSDTLKRIVDSLPLMGQAILHTQSQMAESGEKTNLMMGYVAETLGNLSKDLGADRPVTAEHLADVSAAVAATAQANLQAQQVAAQTLEQLRRLQGQDQSNS